MYNVYENRRRKMKMKMKMKNRNRMQTVKTDRKLIKTGKKENQRKPENEKEIEKDDTHTVGLTRANGHMYLKNSCLVKTKNKNNS